MFLARWCDAMTRIKLKHLKVISTVVVFVYLCDYFGFLARLSEIDYYTGFAYSPDVNVVQIYEQISRGFSPNVQPINHHRFRYVINNTAVCHETREIFLLFLVKTALPHFERRDVIRQTWASKQLHDYTDKVISNVFLLGSMPDEPHLQALVIDEQKLHGDLLQEDFQDTYYNNTLKTIMAFKWASGACKNVRYFMFVDDDYYVSVKNTIKYLLSIDVGQVPDLYSGYVFFTRPMRHKPSKFYVTLEEYPFSYYPPFIAAGAYVVNNSTLHKLYVASQYTKRFRFDDVFLGILALRVGFVPKHNSHFCFWKKYYSRPGYRHIVVSHGYGDSNELKRVWLDQQRDGANGSTEQSLFSYMVELLMLARDHFMTVIS